MAEQVPDEVKSDRLARLQAVLASQQQAFNQACLGRGMPILLEKPGRHQGQLVGRSPYLQSVYIDARTYIIGDMVNVTIDAVGSNSLSAHIQA
jgi:tRNA-2-methylthio-N6-dimethylallyladenosine synthase